MPRMPSGHGSHGSHGSWAFGGIQHETIGASLRHPENTRYLGYAGVHSHYPLVN